MRRLIIAMGLALALAVPAFADSWPPPKTTSYLSANRAFRFTAMPRDLQDTLSYFSDKVDGKEPAGQRKGGPQKAMGRLERRVGSGWSLVWQAPLANDVAPVSALVTNDGTHIVTFDNWYSTGFGENVVVIYREDGSVVRSMQLTDILPEDYVRVLPTSVSSMDWGGNHSLSKDQKRIILKIIIPDLKKYAFEWDEYLDVAIDLETGHVSLSRGGRWEQAMVYVAPLAARSKAAEATFRAQKISPLRSPRAADNGDWQRYLYQAAMRLKPARNGLDVAYVLPKPSDPAYVDTVKGIKAVFSEFDAESQAYIASPSSPAQLTNVINEAATKNPRDRLRGALLMIALPASYHPKVASALARTGAEVVIFDPAVPIPQRPETLREFGVAPQQVEAEVRRLRSSALKWETEAVRLEAVAAASGSRGYAALVLLIVLGVVAATVAGTVINSSTRSSRQL